MADDKIRYIYVSGKHSRGRRAAVDADLYNQLIRHSWYCNDCGYVLRKEPGVNRNIRMHHDVIGFPEVGFEADHINGDTFDNRRENLRFVSKEQQMQNRAPWGEISYKGVRKDGNAVVACMKIGGVQLHLGPYPNEIAAAMAYDAMAFEFYGEHARLNFPYSEPIPPEIALQLRTARSRKQSPHLYRKILAKLKTHRNVNGKINS